LGANPGAQGDADCQSGADIAHCRSESQPNANPDGDTCSRHVLFGFLAFLMIRI